MKQLAFQDANHWLVTKVEALKVTLKVWLRKAVDDCELRNSDPCFSREVMKEELFD